MRRHLLAGGRVPGNREVSRSLMRARRAEHKKEGGTWGKPGFPHGSGATREEMLRALAEAREREKIAAAPA